MNVRLLVRIIAPVVATSLLILALGVGAAWYVHSIQARVSDELRTNTGGLRAGEEVAILVRDMRAEITEDRDSLEKIRDKLLLTEDWLKKAETSSATPRKKELMSRAHNGYQRFVHEYFDCEHGKLLVKMPAGSFSDDERDRIDLLLKKEIQDPAQQYLDFSEEEVLGSNTENQTFADHLVWGLLLLGMCGCAAGLLAGFGVARGVINQLREGERQVLQAQQLASVGQLAAGMAHELRNPLTSMKILVQAALDGQRPVVDGQPFPSSAPCLAGRDLIVLEEEIIRLEQLVHSFLQFARPPAVDKKSLDIRPLIEQTIGLLAGRASLAQTRIDFRPPAEAILANVDPGQLRQVLLNLLLNALEAGKPGATIEVSLEIGPSALTIRVADQGCGLPPQLGPQIFAPFVTTKEAGLGLGLSICKRIAEAHGGDITAANRPGGGAIFSLRLPAGRKQESGIRSQESGIRSQESGVRRWP